MMLVELIYHDVLIVIQVMMPGTTFGHLPVELIYNEMLLGAF